MGKIRLGVIGVGGRSFAIIKSFLSKYEDIEICMLCDLYEDKMQRVADFLNENYGITPVCATNYHEVLNKELVDAVYVATSWETHIEISIAAMKAGIPVGCEVGRAYTVEECFDLVKTYEETKTPFMLLENCCFGKEELLATAAGKGFVLAMKLTPALIAYSFLVSFLCSF